MDDVFRMDDGVQVVELRVRDLLDALGKIRRLYAECTRRARAEVCYASTFGELSRAFGGLVIRVFHDEDFRYFMLRGVEDSWLVADTELGEYRVETTKGIVEYLLRRPREQHGEDKEGEHSA